MRSRFRFAPWQKAVLWIASLLTLWRILQVPAVFDALLRFYAAGEVPGTHRVLSPQGVFLLLSVVCALAALAIFSRLYILPWWHRRQSMRSVVPERRVTPWSSLEFGAHLRRVAALTVRVVQLAFDSLQRFWHWFEPYARRMDHWIERLLKAHAPTARALKTADDVLHLAHHIQTKADDLRDRFQARSKPAEHE